MNKDLIKLIQTELSKETGIVLTADGIAGKNTFAALQRIPQIPTHWDVDRQIVGYIQYLSAKHGIDAGPIDGRWGPRTEQAYEELETKLSGNTWIPWRNEEGEGVGDIVGGLFDSKNDWPLQTQSELEKYYGAVGTNQTKITSPYPLHIAWDLNKTITKFSCHEKVADSLVRVLERVHDHYGDRVSELGLDLFGGCLNVRKLRGGTAYSTHSWGISVDWDPERNKLRWGRDRANFAKPVYNKWNDLWAEEGWVSLGRAKNYDYMHYQAAKVRKK